MDTVAVHVVAVGGQEAAARDIMRAAEADFISPDQTEWWVTVQAPDAAAGREEIRRRLASHRADWGDYLTVLEP